MYDVSYCISKGGGGQAGGGGGRPHSHLQSECVCPHGFAIHAHAPPALFLTVNWKTRVHCLGATGSTCTTQGGVEVLHLLGIVIGT